MNRTVAKIGFQDPVDDYERLIRILAVVPNEINLQFHHLELVAVHFGDDLGLSLPVEQFELLDEVN